MSSAEEELHSNEMHSTVASTTGGVMTKEVGAVTGDLEIATYPLEGESLQVKIRYDGAEEWYSVEGSPIELGNASSGLLLSDLRDLHERVVKHLTTSGIVMEGNMQATSLVDFSPAAGDESERTRRKG